MGIRAINWATRQRVGNATAKHALLWLAFHANEKSGECFPSVELLMEEMEVGSKNTVKAALKTLIDAGLISSKREMKGTRVSRTFYRLNLDGSISDPSNIDGSNIDRSNIDADGSNFDGHGSISDRVMGQPLTPNKEVNREENKESTRISMRTSGNSSAIAAVASAQAQTPYPEDFDQSLFDEAMLATQDSEQAPEALPDPDADLPPKKQRRSQQPRVPFPETLPDDWAEAAKIARPDIDPQRVFLKLRARYAPTTTKKTLATWKREFMNWIGKEFAYDNRYRSSAQKPQRTLGATDTRSLNHRNFGKWASHAV